jgi:hypothetical protein
MTKDEWKRLLLHVPHGVGITVAMICYPPLGWAWWALCLFYQWIEDWRIKDNSYLDVRGYMTGMALGLLFYPPIAMLIGWWVQIWR